MKSFLIALFAFLITILSVSLTPTSTEAACVSGDCECWLTGNTNYALCSLGSIPPGMSSGTNHSCLDNNGTEYACCWDNNGGDVFNPDMDCPNLTLPTLAPTATTAPGGPSPTPRPPTPVPSGPPVDPTCGNHLQPCCNSANSYQCVTGLICKTMPFGPNLCCDSGGGSTDCPAGLGPGETPGWPAFFCSDQLDALQIHTAIGCIPILIGPFMSTALRWGIGLAGGVIIIVLIIASIMIAGASGDPKKVQAGREMIMAALGGLILVVFSVLILNIIGVRILNIGDLGFRL